MGYAIFTKLDWVPPQVPGERSPANG